ncbi:hypothetical protein FACS1894153_1280 [Bacteroidia bacterium]|nr:hypothetical protein FACS1894153_1280 [Bacteroidia bacterium]
MKKILFILLSIYYATTTFSQSTYAYDASGNRVSRTISMSSLSTPKNTNDTNENVVQQEYFDQIGKLEFTIYPNPTKGEIHITNPTEVAGQIQLFDSQGRMLNEIHCKQGDNTLDIYTQPQGIYILRIIYKSKIVNWKIIKE